MIEGRKTVKVGIDLVGVEKVRKVFEGRRSLQEITFTAQELSDLLTNANPYAYLAGCFAAKEAVGTQNFDGNDDGSDP
jgi:phosphopantetheine--protein transferase-like protein